MQTATVSALEYVALKKVEEMVRICMINPNAGEMLAVALNALDQVRFDLKINKTADMPEIEREASPLVSNLAKGLIERAMEKR